MQREALDGVRILDISTVIAGPFGAGILADFGAEVIKVEMPGRGDTFRAMGPLKDGVSIRWPSMGRNKKSITLDFHFDEGKKVFLDLVKKSDVIIENFRTGTLAKWGMGIDVLRQANPDIIVTHVTGYGQTGPNAKLAGLGLPLGAFSGMTYMQGYPDRAPVSPPFALADFIAGLNVVMGTMIALYHRDALKGKGQEVDVSLYEGILRMEENFIAQLDVLGINKERTPMPSGSSVPIGTNETKDGKWVVMVCSTDPVFAHLCDAMERPDWLPKYEKSKARLPDAEILNGAMREWVHSLTYAELKEKCDKAGMPVAQVMSMKDIFEDPHYKARNDIVDVQVEEEFGHVKMPNAFPFMSETPGRIKWPGQKLGASNEAIYKGILGMSNAEIEELRAKKVI